MVSFLAGTVVGAGENALATLLCPAFRADSHKWSRRVAEHINSLSLNFISLALLMAYMYICGRFAAGWLRDTLLKRGYVLSTETNA